MENHLLVPVMLKQKIENKSIKTKKSEFANPTSKNEGFA